MRKKLLLALAIMSLLVCIFAISVNAAAPAPQKPQLDVDFGEVTTIDGFAAPSELFVGTTQRVLLTDGEGNYVTYPTYYVTKNSTTFDFDFSNLNTAQSIQYTKKSVVMLEIPNGITTISGSYFAGTGNFPLCVSVQFPGTITVYNSSTFSTNSVIRVVEFLDGTEPVTMGDAMFGSNWSVGTTNLEYVRFPNNLVSIGNSTFGKSHASKTIILGENLKSIGTGFFGESTPDNKDTHIYVSSKFFAEDEMFTNLFGSYDQYHKNALKITLFYAGSKEEAEAFVEKGKGVQSGYVFDKTTLVSKADYDYDTHKPKSSINMTLVYGYEICDLFYDGHKMSEEAEMQFTSYFEPIKFASVCENGTCTHTGYDESKTIGAIFKDYGYSMTEVKIGDKLAMSQFFGIDDKNLKAYTDLTGESFEYGIVVSSNADPLNPENAGLIEAGKTHVTKEDKIAHDYIIVSVAGFVTEGESANADKGLAFCMFIKDGEKTSYLDNGKTVSTVELKSYNQIKDLITE